MIKLTTILALIFAGAAVGMAVAMVWFHTTPDRVTAFVIGGFVVAAAFFTNPTDVSSWIIRALDHLPGKKSNE